MGEVYKPEDIVRGKRRSSDLSPNLNRITPSGLQNIMKDATEQLEKEDLATYAKEINQKGWDAYKQANVQVIEF